MAQSKRNGPRKKPRRAAPVAVDSNETHPARPDTPYPQYLRSRIHELDKTKGQRTRDSLLVAAAELLEEVGYRGLRVTDINERAGVSNALFYTYFKDKEEISREVMTGFLTTLYEHDEAESRPRSTEESIYLSTLGYIRRFQANAGLMRCLPQFGDEIREFRSLWRDSNRVWLQRVVNRLSREPALAGEDVDAILSTVSALGMMVDGFLRLLYIDMDPMTRLHAKPLLQDPKHLSLFLTRLWIRALFGRDTSLGPQTR